jgi:hypothetical protein
LLLKLVYVLRWRYKPVQVPFDVPSVVYWGVQPCALTNVFILYLTSTALKFGKPVPNPMRSIVCSVVYDASKCRKNALAHSVTPCYLYDTGIRERKLNVQLLKGALIN